MRSSPHSASRQCFTLSAPSRGRSKTAAREWSQALWGCDHLSEGRCVSSEPMDRRRVVFPSRSSERASRPYEARSASEATGWLREMGTDREGWQPPGRRKPARAGLLCPLSGFHQEIESYRREARKLQPSFDNQLCRSSIFVKIMPIENACKHRSSVEEITVVLP
jgi:hypothetical protein